MFFKKPSHKIFDYTPQFYDPEKDEDAKELERRKRRLGFRTARTRHGVKIKNPLYYIVLFIIILYIYLQISGTI